MPCKRLQKGKQMLPCFKVGEDFVKMKKPGKKKSSLQMQLCETQHLKVNLETTIQCEGPCHMLEAGPNKQFSLN
jgi:hypothetical protein